MASPQRPSTRREDITDDVSGVRVPDPFRWLEEDTDEVLSWQSAENAVAEASLHGWPHFATLRAEIAALTFDARVAAPVQHGERWFTLVAPSKDAEHRVLIVSDDPRKLGRVLIDPNALATERGVPVAIDWLHPSPSGRYVAVGISEAGSEQSVLHLVDVDTGALLPDRIEHCAASPVAWLRDETGFFVAHGAASQLVSMQQQLFFHRVGSSDEERLEVDIGGDICPEPQTSHDGRWLAIVVGAYEPRPWWLRDLTASDAWRPFLRDASGTYAGFIAGNHFVAWTTDGAPRGRIVAIPLDLPDDRAAWREIVPESDAVIRGIAFAGGRILASELRDAQARIRVFSLDGTPQGEIPSLGAGTVALGSSQPDSDLVTLLYTAVECAPCTYLYDLGTHALTPLVEPEVRIDGIVAERSFAPSADGTRIPMLIFRKGDGGPLRARPTLIYAYGGFNLPMLPSYFSMWATFLEAGGTLVIPALRGGGEFGDGWWKSGRLGRKQNTFDDLYACAETLVADGVAERGRLAVLGGSNGGMLTAVAITQRPELWRCVVSIVPVCDLFRTVVRDPYTSYATTHEYGDPRDPVQAQWLRSYSPYHNVADGVRYPAILITAGARDVRCPPWHARKMAAALQSATSSEAPILLRVEEAAGHGFGRPTSAVILEHTHWTGFVMQQLGMEPRPLTVR